MFEESWITVIQFFNLFKILWFAFAFVLKIVFSFFVSSIALVFVFSDAMISRVVRQTVERVLITRELLLFPAFLAFSPLDQRRNYAKQRKRSKYVDPIAIKKTGSTKKMVEFYKDMTAK